MVERIGLNDRQGVHVGAQAHRTATVADAKRADEAGLADASVHLAAELFEFVRHQVGGAPFLETEFRVGMNVAPPRRHVAVKRGDAFDNRH